MTVVSAPPTTYYNFFNTTLRRSMTSASQTAGIVLDPILDNNGDPIIFGSSFELILRFQQGAKKEIVSAGGFTQDGNGNITLIDVTRDLPWSGASFTGGSNPVKFTSKASVFLSLTAQSLNNLAFLGSEQTFTGKKIFSAGTEPPIFANNTLRDVAFPSPWNGLYVISNNQAQIYYNSTWNVLGTASVSTATESVEGTTELATLAEHDPATTGPRVVQARNTRKNSTGALEGHVVALSTGGKIDPTLLPVSSASISGLFGDGTDGDVTLVTDITLTRDMNYNNLNLSTFTINTAGFKIFVKETLSGSGKIKAQSGGNGGNGANGVNSANVAGGTAGVATTAGTLPASIAGVAGAQGTFGGTLGNAGTAGLNSTNSIANISGSNGGNSQNGTSFSGGTGGTSTFTGKNHIFYLTLFASNVGATWTTLTSIAGSGSGAGGGSVAGANGGGGGGGSGANGGDIVLFAKTLSGTFTIESFGGNGGNGGNGFGSGSGGGGGAGGSGGCAVVAYSASTWTGVFALTGGTGGSPGTGGTSSAGQAGKAGRQIVFQITNA